ncbi:MAG: type II toxin-antitoxin system YafQ family toxin [Bacteroides sp.]|nr:type II toxin-antitoxin system YafQ family toxin [Bacteroides sp.]MBD5338153.1 type II toxin-antitoxin system YafQ family toxin [Bacteroides sp.]MBD5380148.1 type II toxin-antitoxin system YafQ family toxin [Bacteroides sp.]MDE5820903.1 type II toxin-antitoxin system YafQ family toxin [Paramuribaculum sp.]MDE7413761.1 type II toxin-antitoxin system YafQ family toxin [Muribaculaceae bacterium]
MKTLKITTQFKKDLKRYKNRPKVIEKLEFILGLLQNELPIPEENKPHPLTGNYRGHMECHVENDTLLIWWDKESDIIKLVRFGTHSELF